MHLLASILTALTVLSVPKDKVGTPVLFGSRIVEVNRPHGKVFAPGQRNPMPQVMLFQQQDSCLVLIPELTPRRRRRGPQPVVFPIVEETADTFSIALEPYFSTYPEEISAIPPKMLPGPAVEHALACPTTSPDYLQVNGRYRYGDGLEVTVACYFLWLREKPLPPIDLDLTQVGYNFVEGRRPRGRFQRWDLTGGRKLEFYVDKTFPAEWYPYIQEGIEDWNKAFQAIGFGDVLAVHPEPEGLDKASPLVNMVRYMDVEESNAKGDVLIDPRSGEILQGDILWWKNVVDLLKGWRYVQTGVADPQARQRDLPMEILGPMIRHAVCHEMGHVLGLSHNMGASWAYPADSLRSPSFTRKYGTSASVMDYARYNHLATAADVRAGVALLPPRLGPYDYYAIACGYGPDPNLAPGPCCYFAPMITAAIPPDPSAQPESLGDDLLRSSQAGVENCRTLLTLDGLTPERQELLKKYYYRYLSLALSNIGGVTKEVPVTRKVRRKTLSFVMDALARVPAQLKDPVQERITLDELVGNFLPERLVKTVGQKELDNYYRHLRRLHKKYPELPLKPIDQWKYNN
jgi:hypothetical protein